MYLMAAILLLKAIKVTKPACQCQAPGFQNRVFVRPDIPWVPEVFSRASVINFRLKAEPTSGEAARKTSGPERYDLPFPLNFDRFYRI